MEWGYQSMMDGVTDSNTYSYIRIFSEALGLKLAGPYFGPVNDGTEGHFGFPNGGQTAYPAIYLNVPIAGGSSTLVNQWHHILISANIGSADTLTAAEDGGNITHLTQNTIIGIRLDKVLYRAANISTPFGLPFTPSSMDGAAATYAVNYPSVLTSGGQAYDMTATSMSGLETVLPATSSNSGFPTSQSNVKLAYAYTQAWFDRALDISDPVVVSKFLTANGKPPANPFTASNFFGRPAIHFYRDKKKRVEFKTNNGTAGSFTLVGSSPVDFSPGPGG